MMHAKFRELLALGLYDEVTAQERSQLDEHLKSCAACRDFGEQLDRGLGRVAGAQPGADLSGQWIEQLRASVPADDGPRLAGSSGSLVTSFSAGLVAGLAAAFLAMTAWQAHEDGSRASTEQETPLPKFVRQTPPPPAVDQGQLAQLVRTILRK